jgi:hypothetical protein
MDQQLVKQVTFLKIYSGALTVVVIIGFLFIFNQIDKKSKFKEIDVERINVVENSGKLKMVISNQERQHPGHMDGKDLKPRQREAGIIFFNSIGDECGGLVYDGDKKGGSMALSLDQFKNDQIMQLQYNENEENNKQRSRSYGLKLWDRSDDFTLGKLIATDDSLKKLNNEAAYLAAIKQLKSKGLLGQERLFVGKNKDNEVGIFIKDKKGLPRIKLYVDNNNRVVIQALDENGTSVPFNN